MNHYGHMAMAHWRQHRPTELATIEDPTAYFADLGGQVQSAVTAMRDEILAKHPTTDPAELRRRARQATAMAEEVVLADLVLLAAEPSTSRADPTLDAHYRALTEANQAINEQL